MKTPASKAWELKRGFIAPELMEWRTQHQTRLHMTQAIEQDKEHFMNVSVGFDLTKLAEDAADELEIYENGYEIPEWVFELAGEVAETLGLLE